MLAMIITCGCLFGSSAMVIDGVIMEGTPEHRIHSIIARSDAVILFGTFMLALGLHFTGCGSTMERSGMGCSS